LKRNTTFNHTVSAILRGIWLMDKTWLDAHMPLVVRMMKGEPVTFGQPLAFSGDDNDEVDERRKQPVQVSAVGFKVDHYTKLDRIPQNSVALVDLVGPITRYGGMCSYGLEDKADLLRKLYYAGNIAGIVISANTPGGEASGTAMFADLVAKRNKPVYGHIEDGIAASAGMWIMSQCDELYVSNSRSSVGSIGAYTSIADWYAYFEAEGLKVRDIYAPQSIDKNADYREALKGNDSLIEAQLEELVNGFIADVKAGRGGKIRQSGNEPFTGKMYNAAQAKKLGLLDGIASIEQVIDKTARAGKKYKQVSNNLNNNSMATTKNRPNLAKAAGLEEGATADEQGNVVLTEEQADTVETALAIGSHNAATVQTQAEEITRLTNELSSMTTKRNTAVEELSTATQERDDARAEVARLGSEQANTGTTVTTTEDTGEATGTAAKKLDPITAKAQQIYERNQSRLGKA
jgi:ClpP class serine protease